MSRVYLDSSLKNFDPRLLKAGIETIFQQLEDQLNAGTDIVTLTDTKQTLPVGMQRGDIVFNIQRGELLIGVYNGADVFYASFGSFTGAITDAQHGTRAGGNLHPVVTTSVAGFMHPADKAKLDGVVSSNIAPLVVASWQYYSTSATPTANNHFHFNNSSYGSVTELYATRIGDANQDWSLVMDNLISGNRITIQDANDSLRWVKFAVTGPPTSLPSGTGSYYTIPVTMVSESGALIANNQTASVGFTFSAS